MFTVIIRHVSRNNQTAILKVKVTHGDQMSTFVNNISLSITVRKLFLKSLVITIPGLVPNIKIKFVLVGKNV